MRQRIRHWKSITHKTVADEIEPLPRLLKIAGPSTKRVCGFQYSFPMQENTAFPCTPVIIQPHPLWRLARHTDLAAATVNTAISRFCYLPKPLIRLSMDRDGLGNKHYCPSVHPDKLYSRIWRSQCSPHLAYSSLLQGLIG